MGSSVASVLTIEQRLAAGAVFDGRFGGATGTVTVVAGSAINHDESFFLIDGMNPVTQFTFDKTGELAALESDTRIIVRISNADSVAVVRRKVAQAINRAPLLEITARQATTAGVITLVNTRAGPHGNKTPPADTVANPGFVVTPMTGGVLEPATLLARDGVIVYEAATFGGMFRFGFNGKRVSSGVRRAAPKQWRIERVYLAGGATDSCTIGTVKLDGVVSTIATLSGGELWIRDSFLLCGDEDLVVLSTTPASTEIVARITAVPVIW